MSDTQKISLAREYLDEKNCSDQEILNFFKRASNEFKGEIELAAVRKKILGLAEKIRINSQVERGNRLEYLMQVWLDTSSLQMKHSDLYILVLLCNSATEDTWKIEDTNIGEKQLLDYKFSQDFFSEISNWETGTDEQSLSSGIKSDFKTIRPIENNFFAELVSPQELYSFPKIFSTNTPNINFEVPSPSKVFLRTEDLAEREIISNIFMMLFGVNSKIFFFESQTFSNVPLKVKHLTEKALTSFMVFFTSLGTELFRLSSEISRLQSYPHKYFNIFSHSLSVFTKDINRYLALLHSQFAEMTKHITLISLYCSLQNIQEKVKILNGIISQSIIFEGSSAWKTSFLLSKISFFVEDNRFEINLNGVFHDLFSEYVNDIMTWICIGTTNDCFMIGKVLTNEKEWEKFGLILEKHEGNAKCVPNFLQNLWKPILAIGNYAIVHRSLPGSDIKNDWINKMHREITEILEKSLEDFETVQLYVNSLFGKWVEQKYVEFGNYIFCVFLREFELLQVLQMLRGVYLLEDPYFLDIFEEVFSELHTFARASNVSAKFNTFFYKNHYKMYFSCDCSPAISSISSIKFHFVQPVTFGFILRDSLQTYQHLMTQLLQVKFSNFLIKQSELSYKTLHLRNKYLHFMDCINYYIFLDVIFTNTLKFKQVLSESQNIHSLRKAHSKYIKELYNRLLLIEKYKNIYQCIQFILQEIRIFSNESAEKHSKNAIKKFSISITDKISFLLQVLKKHSESHIVYLSLCFNSFYT